MSRSSCFPEEASDLSKSFDCIQTIVRGESTMHQVICTRGRLRGRILALKKVSRSSKLLSSSVSAASLHQTLHHPNIASLYCITSALSSDYHVLEFCSEGNLTDLLSSRNPSILSEVELRRVLKGIGSALVYLKDERVIHRNICPSTILFAEDMKPKLSDFEQAVRLPQGDNFIFGSLGITPYPPPDPVPSSHPAYDFAVDIWSLGCTAQRCVHGKYHGPGYESHLSPPNSNLQDLLSGLLEMNHAHRMDASQILKHPFITNDSTVRLSSKVPGTLETSQGEKPERITGICGPSLDLPCHARVRDQNANTRSRPLSTLAIHLNHPDRRQFILGDVSNIDTMRKPNFRYSFVPDKRVFSDPVSFKTPYFIAEEKPTNSESTLNSDVPLTKEKSVLLTEILPRTHDIALPYQNCMPFDGGPQLSIKPPKNLNKIHSILPSLPANNSSSLPIGTTRPQPINTSLLAPKTHKLANGNLTILPSHSLLVDFRENQRRRGLRGDEVLLIDATGTPVKIFGAPHLSVPTCLIEPSNEYTLDTLPPSYWKLYNDVYDLIRQIKQRTPRLTMNTNEAKYTLMANTPMGDIELLLNQGLVSYKGSTSVDLKGKDKSPSMRIKFSRQQCFVEFAQHIVDTHGSEWKKRVKTFTGDFGLLLLENDLSSLERKALHLLADFLQTCQKLELSAVDFADKVLQKPDDCVSVPTLASLAVYKDDTNPAHSDYKSETHIAKDVPSQPSASPFEIRFMQFTGWCIKRHSKGSNAVYNMLFLDGTTVTIDGVHVEFTAQSGNNLKCRIFDSYSYEEVGQRMKSFNDFLRLFD